MNVTASNHHQPSATPAATGAGSRPAASGKTLPPAGRGEPPARQSAAPISIDKALAQIQAYLAESKRQLSFQVDESSGRTIIRVLDPASGEVIRQIPSEEVLKVAAYLDTQGLRTLDEFA